MVHMNWDNKMDKRGEPVEDEEHQEMVQTSSRGLSGQGKALPTMCYYPWSSKTVTYHYGAKMINRGGQRAKMRLHSRGVRWFQETLQNDDKAFGQHHKLRKGSVSIWTYNAVEIHVRRRTVWELIGPSRTWYEHLDGCTTYMSILLYEGTNWDWQEKEVWPHVSPVVLT